MGRAPCCDKANVKKGPWSPEEDAKLKAYIETYGTGNNWIALPQKSGLKRCGKSCRLRWLNYLRPNIKHGGFSEEEDNIICSLYISIGSRWSIIAAQLPGRTDNDIKNYWNTRLKKKLLGRRKQSNPNQHGNGTEDSPCALSNSALERLQLHMQLQGLHNPFPSYNSPSLWPKLHPLQEKALETLHASNFPSVQEINNHDLHEQQAASTKNPMSMVPMVTKSDDLGQSSTFQGELEDCLGNRQVVGDLMSDQTSTDQFDCFKDMSGRDMSLMWWPNNNLESNSTSSNSWESNPALQSDQGMFQGYELGYNM